jgi:PAS domain S-box-containing protein
MDAMTAAAAAIPFPAGEPNAPVDTGAFFDVSLDMLVIRDMHGTVLKASRSWETTLGWAPDELEGTRLLRLVHPDDLPATLDSVVEVETRRPGDPVHGQINRYRHRDGSYRTLEWRAHRLGDRIYGVARDVTDRVAADRALVEAKAAAEAASRAKSDFLANMSHEIRTPLNGVIGLAGVLATHPLDTEQAAIVQMITESGVTLERLVSDLLDMAKIEAGRMTIEAAPFDLASMTAAASGPHAVRARERGLDFQVVLDAPAADARLVGDSARLTQVIGNLLSNAVKFTEAGGVTLTVALQDRGDGEQLVIEVTDTGVGFDPAFMDRLFDRFTQADATITRRFGGTGLGLSICRKLTGMMGGGIDVRLNPEGGSRFVVALPAVRAGEPEAAADTGASTSGLQGLRVLLAEDHPINQKIVQLILGAQGVEIVTVDDGAQAVARASEEAFDLILMDMQMPVMDGLEATRRIRERELGEARGRTPIVMLTANALTQHRNEARAAGADLHMAKPITPAKLLEVVQAQAVDRAA